jgi:uncharacterized protein YciW
MASSLAPEVELRQYCELSVRHSHDQYEKHGTLHEKAADAFTDASVWGWKWIPDDFDMTEARHHPVWQAWTDAQKLAWNHLEWCMEYSAVAQGERQIVVLNNYAVANFAHTLPCVVDLQRRESYEETDHVAAFKMVIEACHARYFPKGTEPVWSVPASGLTNPTANRVFRKVMGVLGDHLLGSNFPTLFFLARGMKTHGFKPFENAIARYEDGHKTMRMIAYLHRLDESRHMATSLNLARLSTAVLDELPKDNRLLFTIAVNAAFPSGRSHLYPLSYWRRVLDGASVYADVPRHAKDELLRHMESRLQANLSQLHQVQVPITRQANKRIVEDCGLSKPMKQLFVDILRRDPAYACTIDAVDLDSLPA